MKKQNLMTLAMIGIGASVLVAGCEKGDTRRDNRDNRPGSTASADQTSPVAINQSCGGGCGGQQPNQAQQYDASQRYYLNSQYQQGQNQGQVYYQGQQGQQYQGAPQIQGSH